MRHIYNNVESLRHATTNSPDTYENKKLLSSASRCQKQQNLQVCNLLIYSVLYPPPVDIFNLCYRDWGEGEKCRHDETADTRHRINDFAIQRNRQLLNSFMILHTILHFPFAKI